MDEILDTAADAFVLGGYEGTSIDDLVTALNLHRGSLYKAFGSKRGLFLAVLERYVDSRLTGGHGPGLGNPTPRPNLDLLLIAAVERGHRDAEVATLVRRGLDLLEAAIPNSAGTHDADGAPHPNRAVRLLGDRLYERLLIDPDQTSSPQELTPQET